MRRLLILILLLLYVTYANAGRLKRVTVLSATNNKVELEVLTSYGFSGSTCPPLIGVDTISMNDKLTIKLYRDITGVWNAFSATCVDTVNVNVKTDGIKELRVEMYSAHYYPSDTDTVFSSPTWTLFLPLTVVDKGADQDDIRIYPNPNKGRFVLEAPLYFSPPEAEEGPVTVEVMNSVGQIVYRDEFVITGSILKHTVNMEDAPEGIYWLRLLTMHRALSSKIHIVK